MSWFRAAVFAVSSPSMTCCARSGWSRLRRKNRVGIIGNRVGGTISISSAAYFPMLVAGWYFLPPHPPHPLRQVCALPFATCDYARPSKRLKGTGIPERKLNALNGKIEQANDGTLHSGKLPSVQPDQTPFSVTRPHFEHQCPPWSRESILPPHPGRT